MKGEEEAPAGAWLFFLARAFLPLFTSYTSSTSYTRILVRDVYILVRDVNIPIQAVYILVRYVYIMLT